jgi:hypothetical protein
MQEDPMRHSLMIAAVAAVTSLAGLAPVSAKTSVDTSRDGRTVVTAPGTRVAVVPKRTKVRVEAPFSDIKVDTAARHVRIRVPFYNGDITW